MIDKKRKEKKKKKGNTTTPTGLNPIELRQLLLMIKMIKFDLRL